jgi:hypothetical protein
MQADSLPVLAVMARRPMVQALVVVVVVVVVVQRPFLAWDGETFWSRRISVAGRPSFD